MTISFFFLFKNENIGDMGPTFLYNALTMVILELLALWTHLWHLWQFSVFPVAFL